MDEKKRSPVRLLSIAALVFSFFLLRAEPAGEEGGAQLGIDHRYIDQGAKDYLTNFHLDLWQNWLNIGAFNLWIDWNTGRNSQTINTLGRGFATLNGFRLSRLSANGLVGDFSLRYTQLQKHFSNSTYPDVYYRGARLEIQGSPWHVQLYGGRVTRPEGLLGNTYTLTEESAYGFSMLFQPKGRFRVGSGLLISGNREQADSTVTLNLNNRIFFLDSQWQVYEWLYWLGEWRLNFSREQNRQSINGKSFKLGSIIDTERFRFEFNYRFADQDFRFLKNAAYPDANQQGVFLLGNWQLGRRLNVFFNYDRSRITQPSSSGLTQTDSNRLHLGSNLRFTRSVTLSLYYNSSSYQSLPDSPAPVQTDYTFNSFFSELRFNLGRTQPYLRLHEWQFDDRQAPDHNYLQHMITGGIRRQTSRYMQVYTEAEWNQRESPLQDQKRLCARVGFQYHRFAIGLWGEAIYNLREEGTRENRNSYLTGALGLSYPLFWGLNLYLDARYDRWVDYPVLGNVPNKFQITLRLSRRFRWGEPARVAGLKTGLGIRGYGSIEGTIFIDHNLDLKRQGDEPGFGEGIEVSLEDGTTVKTDRRGFFRFPRVAPGSHFVSLDISTIPVNYNILSPETGKVEVRLRERTEANFSLIISGRICGRLILDENDNSRADPGEKGLSDVLVFLGSGEINTYTNEQGEYNFENLNPGAYLVKVDATTLPENTVFVTPPECAVTLTAGGEARGVDFVLKKKERPVVIRKLLDQAGK